MQALDIRLPLTKPPAVPGAAFIVSADWLLGLRWPMTLSVGGSIRRRVDRVTLVAEGIDWSWGAGPEVRGPAAGLMLLLTGRSVPPSELTGLGAALLTRV